MSQVNQGRCHAQGDWANDQQPRHRWPGTPLQACRGPLLQKEGDPADESSEGHKIWSLRRFLCWVPGILGRKTASLVHTWRGEFCSPNSPGAARASAPGRAAGRREARLVNCSYIFISSAFHINADTTHRGQCTSPVPLLFLSPFRLLGGRERDGERYRYCRERSRRETVNRRRKARRVAIDAPVPVAADSRRALARRSGRALTPVPRTRTSGSCLNVFRIRRHCIFHQNIEPILCLCLERNLQAP